jgi:hypothetical protein
LCTLSKMPPAVAMLCLVNIHDNFAENQHICFVKLSPVPTSLAYCIENLACWKKITLRLAPKSRQDHVKW